MIVTTGEAVVKMAPDRVWVTIAAESRAKSPREAQRANADAMKAVLDKLKAAGLPADAIRTAGYDLQPEFDYVNGKQSLRGLRCAKYHRSACGRDYPCGGDPRRRGWIGRDQRQRYPIRSQGSRHAERQALREAVADARGRADAAAAGAGMKVDRVVRIEEQRAMMPSRDRCTPWRVSR